MNRRREIKASLSDAARRLLHRDVHAFRRLLIERDGEHFMDDDFRRQLERETGVRPEWAAEAFDDLDDDIRQNIERIRLSPFITSKESIRGFVYDIETGKLREVT